MLRSDGDQPLTVPVAARCERLARHPSAATSSRTRSPRSRSQSSAHKCPRWNQADQSQRSPPPPVPAPATADAAEGRSEAAARTPPLVVERSRARLWATTCTGRASSTVERSSGGRGEGVEEGGSWKRSSTSARTVRSDSDDSVPSLPRICVN